MISLLIADDHPLYRDALKSALSLSFENPHVLEAQDLAETIGVLEQHEVDLLLLDLHMPGSGDLYGVIRIRKLFPELPLAVVSGVEDPRVIAKVMKAGALGFVPKTASAAHIADAVKSILDGDIWLENDIGQQLADVDDTFGELVDKVSSLTPAQYKVLCCMRDGLLNKQIGFKLDIAEATVKAHVTAMFRKLHINNRTQAVLIASQLQLELPDAS